MTEIEQSLKRIVFLNTSIITNDGEYEYRTVDLKEAMDTIAYFIACDLDQLSAIGHESTALILSGLLKLDIGVNRIEFKQETTDLGIVFKLKGRPEEGKILSRGEVEEIGYTFGLLIKRK